MFEIALEITRDARDMAEILMLTVTPRQARENTNDLGRPLGTKHGKSKPQLGLIETRLFPPQGAVIIEQLIGNRTGNVDAGILKHRYEVVGGMAENAVLRIDEADAPHPLAPRQPDEIGRVVIAQRPHRSGRNGLAQKVSPGRDIALPLFGGRGALLE